jgi:hypothetical protein
MVTGASLRKDLSLPTVPGLRFTGAGRWRRGREFE